MTSYVLYGNNLGQQITRHGYSFPSMQDADPTPQYDFHVSERGQNPFLWLFRFRLASLLACRGSDLQFVKETGNEMQTW